MNPLLDDAQREHVMAARRAVEEHLVPVADAIDDDGALLPGVLAALAVSGLLGGDADDRVLRLALTVEQVGRKNTAVALALAARGVFGIVAPAVDAERSALMVGDAAVRPDGDGFRLDAPATLVVGVAGAKTLVLVVESGDGAGLWTVPSASPGVSLEVAELLGANGAGAAIVTLKDVAVNGEARIGDGSAAGAARDWLSTVHAAAAVGVARGALDAAVSDVVARRDGGERVDRSQSIQWMLADIATEAEAARVATWYAATQPPGPTLAEAAAMCRVLAAEAAVGATRRAVQVLGERGLLRSAGVERLYRDAKVLEILGGSVEANLARVAAHRLPELTRA